MYTGLMIGLIVLGATLSTVVAWALAVLRLGKGGGTILALVVGGTAAVVYRTIIRPWHLRWGATDEEMTRPMPGDELLPGSEPCTRAITIEASAEAI